MRANTKSLQLPNKAQWPEKYGLRIDRCLPLVYATNFLPQDEEVKKSLSKVSYVCPLPPKTKNLFFFHRSETNNFHRHQIAEHRRDGSFRYTLVAKSKAGNQH